MSNDTDLHPVLQGIATLIATPIFIGGQVIAIGGIWAALTGNSFLIWEFESTSVGSALLILFFLEPLIMGASYLVAIILVSVITIPAQLLVDLFQRLK